MATTQAEGAQPPAHTELPNFRNASELPALVSYVRERRCVLFVGAGLSRPAGYPGWGDLMRHYQPEQARDLMLERAKGSWQQSLQARCPNPELSMPY